MSAFSTHAGLANAAILAAFGQPVSYQQGVADPFTVLGVLERKGDEETGDGALYARLFVQTSDFAAAPQQGDVATIAGDAFTVFSLHTDAMGGCWLSLREVA
jgi:hypothetical protein